MLMTVHDMVFILIGYGLGSISSAVLVSHLLALPDPRAGGSKNPGTTNMLRLGGKKAAALTLSGDMLKGFIPVALVQALHAHPATVALTGLAAFMGHLYPVFLGFKGGKGVATLLGVCLGLSWKVGLAACGTWVLGAILFHISSLGALAAAFMAPFFVWFLMGEPVTLMAVSFMSVLLYWRHRTNIYGLLTGTEGKITAAKPVPGESGDTANQPLES